MNKAFPVKKISNCNLMYLYSNNLYTICEGMRPMKLELDPFYAGEESTLIVNTMVYPSPGIRVREIY